MVRSMIASLITAAAVLLSAGAAGAHTGAHDPLSDAPPLASMLAPATRHAMEVRPDVEILRAGASLATAALPVVLVAAAAVAASTSRRRLALALALLSAVVGVDAAVHSVHHLNDPGAAAACVLASGSTHAPAVLTDGIVVAVAPTLVRDAYADLAPIRADLRSSRPDRGRAPPSSAA